METERPHMSASLPGGGAKAGTCWFRPGKGDVAFGDVPSPRARPLEREALICATEIDPRRSES